MTEVRVRGDAVGAPGAGTIWHYRDEGVMAVGVWTERLDGRGEDAEPLFAHRVPAAEGIVGVFDGLGGSGAGAACELRDGTRRSGAWVGARLVRSGVLSWFLDAAARTTSTDAAARATSTDGTALADGEAREAAAAGAKPTEALRTRLVEVLADVPAPPRSKIVSRMRRWLPTTMAAAHYRLGGEQAECRVLWAGDSRAYALSRGGGLQALTRDHTDETDSLQQLVQDPPMTNVICADQEFTIAEHVLLLPLPCVLVCATDGFFGYVETPAHFECHLLSTLRAAADEREWAERLARQVSGYTGDDASLSLAALGYAGFAELRESFAARSQEMEARYPLVRAAEDGADREWRARTWEDYRPDYERLMPATAEPG
ncbi:hypothetical protein OIE67_46290 [Nonomuraea fuscirosea]|uniref:hypothetical protein n=1 Tax=Nonomuraea fuscirosea TaxID=1291556 RepID=UPI002DDB0F27|nr:hypothetical protein [Nonomuraea fuscirosea]WSA51384.1 hypothetical protein OIE67_46290 [Nonomuraea fuscirosea]